MFRQKDTVVNKAEKPSSPLEDLKNKNQAVIWDLKGKQAMLVYVIKEPSLVELVAKP